MRAGRPGRGAGRGDRAGRRQPRPHDSSSATGSGSPWPPPASTPPTSGRARSRCCRSTPTPARRALREALLELTGANVGVVITDTAGRAWREGQTDIAIGAAGLVVAEDFSGRDGPLRQPARGDAARGGRRDRRRRRARPGQAGRPARGRGPRPCRPGAATPATTAPARSGWCGPRAATCSGTAPARPSSAPWPGTRRGPPPLRRPRRRADELVARARAGRRRRGRPSPGPLADDADGGRTLRLPAGADRIAVDRGVLRPRVGRRASGDPANPTWWPPCHPSLRRLCPRPPPEHWSPAPGAEPSPRPERPQRRGQEGQDRPSGGHRLHPQEAGGRREAPRLRPRRGVRPGGAGHHRCGRLPAGQGLVGPALLRVRAAIDAIGAPAVGLRRDHHQEGQRQPGPRRARHPAAVRGLAAGVRPALQRVGRHRPQALQRVRPSRRRRARAQPRARLHDPLVRRDGRRRATR